MAKQISLQPGFQQLQGNKHPDENNIPIRALIGMQRFVSLVITNFFFLSVHGSVTMSPKSSCSISSFSAYSQWASSVEDEQTPPPSHRMHCDS